MDLLKKSWMLVVVPLLVLTLGGCASTPAAAVDPAVAESNFYDLADRILPDADTVAKLNAADAICAGYTAGNSDLAVHRTVAEAATWLNDDEVSQLIDAAVAYRCPDVER